MRFIRQTLVSKVLLCASFCLVLMQAQAGTLTYTGSSTVGQFIEDAMQVYKASTFTIDTLPESSGGEICAYRSKCDIGGVARPVNDRYLDKKQRTHPALYSQNHRPHANAVDWDRPSGVQSFWSKLSAAQN